MAFHEADHAPGRAMRRLRAAVPPGRFPAAIIAAGGAFLAILLLAWVGRAASVPLLIAPFGASCVLVFAVPKSPLAQPRNVIAGHLLASVAGLVAQAAVGATPFGFALGVALAIACMVLTDTVHPPAGADPIVVLLTSAPWTFLVLPVLAGASVIVLIGIAYHRVASRETYPMP